MMTFSGLCVAPSNRYAPSLEAVALGLARESRWCGQTKTWYCVLAHTLLTAELADAAASAKECPPATVLHALLHDAGEMIGRDHPTTWKTLADREREMDILARLYDALGLGHAWPLTPDLAEAVKRYDLVALRAEATVLMPPEIARAEVGLVEPIVPGDPLYGAVEAAKRWAANCRVYDQWLRTGSYWQCQWVQEVRAAMAECGVATAETVPGGAS